MNYRNRDLLDLAYQLPCQLQFEGCEGGIAGEPAHANSQLYGKGGSIKAHDCFFVPACRSCHRELDQGRKWNKEEKRVFWEDAFRRTVLLLWENDLIQVKR